MKAYGSSELEKCVKKLGFTFDSISSSHHAKYIPPAGRDPLPGIRPFFTFQLGRKTYDPNSASRYITQLKTLRIYKRRNREISLIVEPIKIPMSVVGG